MRCFTTGSVIFGMLIFLMGSNVAAQTEVDGDIDTDTIWSITGSPYIVPSSLDLLSGVSLTVDPGVEIRFQFGIQMVVYGTLSAMGSETQPIIFSSDNPPHTHSR